jgi:soluble lytic murein transglycosylase-like protein
MILSSDEFNSFAQKWAAVYRVPVDLVKAIVLGAENPQLNTTAKNPKSSATGIMQVIKGTATWMSNLFGIDYNGTDDGTGRPVDLKDPDKNIQIGTAYLSYLLKRYNGNVSQAVAAYYSGTPNGSYAEQSYVSKVMNYFYKLNGGNTPATADSGGSDQTSSDSSDISSFILWGAAGVAGFLLLRRFR